MHLEDLKQLARDYTTGNIRNEVCQTRVTISFQRRHGALGEKLMSMGLHKVSDADENQRAELYGWFKERIMPQIAPTPLLSSLARDVQEWMNAPEQGEYTRRRKLVLSKLDEMNLQRISDADEAQAQQIRDWIASKP